MRILLIDPPVAYLEGDGSTRFVQPLGLAYVGAALAEAVRRGAPGAPIVLGGVHASTSPAEALVGAPEIDLVVSGEGEGPMVELAAGRTAREIAGLWLRDPSSGRPVSPAGPRPAIDDLDGLSWPLRTGLVWGGQDSDAPAHQVLREALITVRGCPYKCIYCAVPGLDDRRTRYRSAAGVADELAALKERWDVGYLFFHDSVFTLHRRRTLELCAEIVARGLQTPFTCQTGADRIDDEVAAALASAGCHRIFLGIESGDEGSLKRMRKAMPLIQVRRAVDPRRPHRLQRRLHGRLPVGGHRLDPGHSGLRHLPRPRLVVALFGHPAARHRTLAPGRRGSPRPPDRAGFPPAPGQPHGLAGRRLCGHLRRDPPALRAVQRRPHIARPCRGPAHGNRPARKPQRGRGAAWRSSTREER